MQNGLLRIWRDGPSSSPPLVGRKVVSFRTEKEKQNKSSRGGAVSCGGSQLGLTACGLGLGHHTHRAAIVNLHSNRRSQSTVPHITSISAAIPSRLSTAFFG